MIFKNNIKHFPNNNHIPFVKTTKKIRGKLKIPGDKSISHRALLLGLLSVGETRIDNLLECEDTKSTIDAIKLLGAKVKRIGNVITVRGTGVGGMITPHKTLYMGNSGTGCRLLLGIIAGSNITATFSGDESLSKRPMDRIINPLSEMGAKFLCSENSTLPLTITGAASNGIVMPLKYKSNISSAQVKSAVLLAGLSARGITSFTEPIKSRDNTEELLKKFGAKITTHENKNKNYTVKLYGYSELFANNIRVPSDPSSAAFFVAASILTKSSKVELENIYMNPTRAKIFSILKKMGARIIERRKTLAGYPCSNLTIFSSSLNNITLEASVAPHLIDEYPILSVVAACSKGKMLMKGLSELKYKESNRLLALNNGLNKCGVKTVIEDNNLVVFGCKGPPEGGCKINASKDHRIAMAFSILSLVSKKPIVVEGCSSIKSSFPNFFDLLHQSGASINGA